MDDLLRALRELPIPLDDGLSMELTVSERERAHAIKMAAEGSSTSASTSNLNALSDLEYVQWALAHPNSPMSLVLHHMERLQAFKQEYGVEDTLEDGMASLEAMVAQQPGQFLGIHYLPSKCHCVAFCDWGAFSPHICANNPHAQAVYLKGRYYWLQCMNPTPFVVRVGTVEVVECEGVTWEKNYDERFFDLLFEELLVPYPNRYRSVLFLNSPTTVNVAYGMWKRHMSQNMKEAFVLGCKLAGLETTRLNEPYSLNGSALTRQRLLDSARELLQIRYHHQATYTLPPVLSTRTVTPVIWVPATPPFSRDSQGSSVPKSVD